MWHANDSPTPSISINIKASTKVDPSTYTYASVFIVFFVRPRDKNVRSEPRDNHKTKNRFNLISHLHRREHNRGQTNVRIASSAQRLIIRRTWNITRGANVTRCLRRPLMSLAESYAIPIEGNGCVRFGFFLFVTVESWRGLVGGWVGGLREGRLQSSRCISTISVASYQIARCYPMEEEGRCVRRSSVTWSPPALRYKRSIIGIGNVRRLRGERDCVWTRRPWNVYEDVCTRSVAIFQGRGEFSSEMQTLGKKYQHS